MAWLGPAGLVMFPIVIPICLGSDLLAQNEWPRRWGFLAPQEFARAIKDSLRFATKLSLLLFLLLANYYDVRTVHPQTFCWK